MTTKTKTATKTRKPRAAAKAAKPAKTRKPPRAPAARPAKLPAAGSVVKPAYKREHQPDELGQHLSAATSDDKGRVDVEKLQKLAEQHGVWDPRYARLNPGLVRMSVGNRLRAKVRKGAEIVWPA